MKKIAKLVLAAAAPVAAPLALLLASPAFAQGPGPHTEHPASHAAEHGAMDHGAMAPGGRSCFRTSDISNHTVDKDGAIYLKVGLRDVYRLTTKNRCARPFDRTNPLVIKTTAGTGMVCRPIDLDLAISRSGFTEPCILDQIQKLTPAEAAALPKKLKP